MLGPLLLRCPALAGVGEILVTRTVRDLVVGSDLTFTECGEHELKGVGERWCSIRRTPGRTAFLRRGNNPTRWSRHAEPKTVRPPAPRAPAPRGGPDGTPSPPTRMTLDFPTFPRRPAPPLPPPPHQPNAPIPPPRPPPPPGCEPGGGTGTGNGFPQVSPRLGGHQNHEAWLAPDRERRDEARVCLARRAARLPFSVEARSLDRPAWREERDGGRRSRTDSSEQHRGGNGWPRR